MVELGFKARPFGFQSSSQGVSKAGGYRGPCRERLWLYLRSPARLAKQLGLESSLSSSISVSSAGNLRMYLLLVSDVTDASLCMQRSWVMSKGRGQAPLSPGRNGGRGIDQEAYPAWKLL